MLIDIYRGNKLFYWELHILYSHGIHHNWFNRIHCEHYIMIILYIQFNQFKNRIIFTCCLNF